MKEEQQITSTTVEDETTTPAKPPLAREILLPILLTILCAGIIILSAIRPYEKIKTYLRVAFMDSTATASTDGTTAGLEIVDTDIDTDYDGETYDTGTVVIPSYGTQSAILEAESIDLYVPVYWGGGDELLEQGACHTPASAAIGSEGNSVISAHVNTFFANLSDLEVDDIVTVYTTYGRFTYTVTEQITFEASDKSYLQQTEDNRLTLYTCEMQLFGSSDTRIGVICELTTSEFYEEAEEDTTSSDEETAAETTEEETTEESAE